MYTPKISSLKILQYSDLDVIKAEKNRLQMVTSSAFFHRVELSQNVVCFVKN